jgi:hypothetical protein
MKWIDVMPNHWFYRDVLEAGRIRLSPDTDEGLFTGIPYNVFATDKERLVRSYISTENQSEFQLPGYISSPDNPLYVYIETTRTQPALIENGRFVLEAPLSAGLRVTAFSSGIPLLGLDPSDPETYGRPSINGLAAYPQYTLYEARAYKYDSIQGEKCIVLGRSYRRVNVNVRPGETVQVALRRVIGDENNMFTIISGVLYTSYEANGFPAFVQYSYEDSNGVIQFKGEDALPSAPYVNYSDRFFPGSQMLRVEFFTVIHKILSNLYYRFTDTEPAFSTFNERKVPDVRPENWFYTAVIAVLNEKYLDGCYVFPLYEDGSFSPLTGITRAETVMYLNRLIEWTSERFR